METIKIKANLIDIHQSSTYPAELTIENGIIASIKRIEEPQQRYVLPGLVDSHVHIESSMLTPVEFSRLSVIHGTVATVSDPHEIANVLGLEGVRYMIENAAHSPLKFHFGAPSCVPATSFETAGAVLGPKEVKEMLEWPEISYLSEMMNFPAVIHEDKEVMEKIKIAREMGLPIDGHAPQLRGDKLRKYVNSGISTDHECTTYEEALEKIQAGMKISIRQGSAAKNFDALIPLIKKYPEMIMFCTDDKHPDELILHHIDWHVKTAIKKGYDLYDVLRSATLIPSKHYGLGCGLLRESDPADFIIIDHPHQFNILETWIDGKKVASNGRSVIPSIPFKIVNRFDARPTKANDFSLSPLGDHIKVIRAIDGSLITDHFTAEAKNAGGFTEPDIERDLLMIAVVNRYSPDSPSIAFINGFGLKGGALASTVAHDSHNIVAVGSDRESLARAVNALIDCKGGICATDGEITKVLPLPIAGLLADSAAEVVASKYKEIDHFAKEKLGSTLSAPFMTLSFMALLVIPSLKLSDKGLFDGNRFEFVNLFNNGREK